MSICLLLLLRFEVHLQSVHICMACPNILRLEMLQLAVDVESITGLHNQNRLSIVFFTFLLRWLRK
jgi:hypothetical protein